MIYKTLLNINLLHAYFLDNGIKKYHNPNNLTNELNDKEKEEAEKVYKSTNFLEIRPTRTTLSVIKNYRLMVRDDSKGIRILATSQKEIAKEDGSEIERYCPFIELPNDLILTFFVRVTDRYFENYTEIIKKKSNQLYNLSNISTTATNVFDSNGNIEEWSSFLITERESRRLVYELEKENEANSITPKRVTIADIDSDKINAIETKIDNNISLNIDESEIIENLDSSIKKLKNKGIIGVVRLKISGDNNSNLTENVMVKNIETNNFDINKNCLLKEAPTFQIYIENRKTFWRYNQISKSLKMTTNTKQPLTKNGKVEISKTAVTPQPINSVFLPNPTVESITLDSNNQDYYSEIFI